MLMQFPEMLMTVLGNDTLYLGLWDCFSVNDLTQLQKYFKNISKA